MQKIIDNMRGPLTCLVVIALMIMTPFADPQIALAYDYEEYMPLGQMETEYLEEEYLENHLEANDVNKSVEGQLLAMSSQQDLIVENEMTDVSDLTGVVDMSVMEGITEIKTPVVEEQTPVEVKETPSKGKVGVRQDKNIPQPRWRIKITNEQLDLLERCVMAEGGGESYECQVAIACVIINRVISNDYPDSVDEVIQQKGQFSTWPKMIESVTASNQVKQAVREALANEAIPESVLFFRANRYHRWGSRYCRIDNTYFSTP